MSRSRNYNITTNRSRQSSKLFLAAKRIFDITAAVIGLLITLPLYPLIAIAIRLDSPGSIFFSQKRVGKNGILFTLYKFRTMSSSTPAHAMSPDDDETDARITRVGRFLRKSKLDELPQFVNVLRGDMSMVGPRPEMQFIVAKYTRRQLLRLWVKPGISGLWQISPDRNKPIHENLRYDLTYIKSQSLWLDLVIMVKTCILVAKNIKPASLKHAITTTPVPEEIIVTTIPVTTVKSTKHGTGTFLKSARMNTQQQYDKESQSKMAGAEA